MGRAVLDTLVPAARDTVGLAVLHKDSVGKALLMAPDRLVRAVRDMDKFGLDRQRLAARDRLVEGDKAIRTDTEADILVAERRAYKAVRRMVSEESKANHLSAAFLVVVVAARRRAAAIFSLHLFLAVVCRALAAVLGSRLWHRLSRLFQEPPN
jgi:hypothetical protein